MAERASICPDGVVCRYFLTGTCYEGKRCPFSHDPTCYVPDSVCRYYLKGDCFFGLNCRYEHIVLNDKCSRETDIPWIYERLFSGPSESSSYQSRNLINVPELVPNHIRLYVDIMKSRRNKVPGKRWPPDDVCPLFAEGECPFTDCQLIHGEVCELCQKSYLHPSNKEARRSHIENCKKETEFSLAIQRSLDKTCGICLEVVLEKEPESERRFGLLEKCNHVYCFSCISQWWNSVPYDSDDDSALDPVVTRACPQCRIVSDFVTPSLYFVDTGEEKQKLINQYKEALSNIPCKYFKQGDSICPFGGACFYLHAYADGTKVDLPFPIRSSIQNLNGELDSIDRINLEYGMEISQPEADIISEMEYDSPDISDSSDFGDYLEGIENQIGELDSFFENGEAISQSNEDFNSDPDWLMFREFLSSLCEV